VIGVDRVGVDARLGGGAVREDAAVEDERSGPGDGARYDEPPAVYTHTHMKHACNMQTPQSNHSQSVGDYIKTEKKKKSHPYQNNILGTITTHARDYPAGKMIVRPYMQCMCLVSGRGLCVNCPAIPCRMMRS